jgi:hypothetical protein
VGPGTLQQPLCQTTNSRQLRNTARLETAQAVAIAGCAEVFPAAGAVFAAAAVFTAAACFLATALTFFFDAFLLADFNFRPRIAFFCIELRFRATFILPQSPRHIASHL